MADVFTSDGSITVIATGPRSGIVIDGSGSYDDDAWNDLPDGDKSKGKLTVDDPDRPVGHNKSTGQLKPIHR